MKCSKFTIKQNWKNQQIYEIPMYKYNAHCKLKKTGIINSRGWFVKLCWVHQILVYETTEISLAWFFDLS